MPGPIWIDFLEDSKSKSHSQTSCYTAHVIFIEITAGTGIPNNIWKRGVFHFNVHFYQFCEVVISATLKDKSRTILGILSGFLKCDKSETCAGIG